MFLPLWVVGLLVSDISLETSARRNAMLLLSFLCLALAVFVLINDGLRNAVLGPNVGPHDALWRYNEDWLDALLTLFIFCGATALASRALRRHFERYANSSEQTIDTEKK